MSRLRTMTVALVLGLALGGPANGQTEPPRAVFVDAVCDLPDLTPQIRPRLRCGTVRVPRRYDRPDAGSFALSVVVITSARQPARPEPLVYISGGPGAPLTVHTSYQAAHPIVPDRDIILVDQRGMGRSEPGICPSLAGDFVRAVVAVAIDPGAQARRRAVLTACRQDAVGRGIDPDDFGTMVTAEDFDSVRRALGVTRWALFGVSYGTTVAMTLMARHPDTIRAAVLDSVYPPDPILPAWSANVAKARDAFFDFCGRDASCASAFPDLADAYRETLRRLDQAPLTVQLPPRMGFPNDHGPLTSSLFELVVGHMVYYPTFYPDLPGLITAVHDGDTTAFASAVASLFASATDPGTGPNPAANVAVECRDRPRFRGPPPVDGDIFDRTLFYGLCDDWSSRATPPLVPTGTAIPTLVLAGQFDPNARPEDSRHVADLIGAHARWREFPGLGHSVRAFSPCAARIVSDFVDDPARPLDTSCADRPPAIMFRPRP